MREILFRGKREKDGKWTYGLYSDDYVHDTDFACIMPLRSETNYGSWAVVRETIGQYTGLTDKNGKRIFEGDILSYVDCDGYTQYVEIGFKDGYFCFIEEGNEDDNELCSLLLLDPVICGNIHDNPELLKGEKKNDN